MVPYFMLGPHRSHLEPGFPHLGSFFSSLMGLAMYAHFVCLLAVIPFGTLVGAHGNRSSFHNEAARLRARDSYYLQDWYQGEGFFKYVSALHVPCRPRPDPL